MVKITVIHCTKRKEPRFDLALESLKNQTFKDFEYIIVDGFYNERRDDVNELIQSLDLGFDVKYIKDKPCRWKGKRPALCNARNTGLIFANGEHIVFHDDNCQMPADWLETHLSWLEQGYIVAGSWVPYKTESQAGGGIDTRLRTAGEKTSFVGGGWLYGSNFSFPLCVAIDINGFDEELDGEMGQDDISFGIRAERKGYKIIYDRSITVHCIAEFHDAVSDIAPKNIVLNDGIPHFSNEYYTHKLLGDVSRYLPYANAFNLSELRELVRDPLLFGQSIESVYGELEKYIDPNPIDWRDQEDISNL